MDFYSKVFVCNWVIAIALAMFDRILNKDRIEKTPVIGYLFGLWVLLSFISIPVYIVYLVITYL